MAANRALAASASEAYSTARSRALARTAAMRTTAGASSTRVATPCTAGSIAQPSSSDETRVALGVALGGAVAVDTRVEVGVGVASDGTASVALPIA